jgi:gliding motility-associated-like protein
MRFLPTIILVFISHLILSQEAYNECVSAKEICPNVTYTLNNIGANKTVCGGCEDDFTFCFPSRNTIWLKFTTNASGGSVLLNFSNILVQSNPNQGSILQAALIATSLPCNAASYAQIGNCVSNGMNAFSISAISLMPNTTYYVVVSGDRNGGALLPAEATFDLTISGTSVDRIQPTISISPASATICKGAVFMATASVTNCPDSSTYQWFINGILAATTSQPTFQSSNLNQGDVLSVQTACFLLCKEIITSQMAPITVQTIPVTAGSNQSILAGNSVQLQGSTTASSYSWSPTTALSAPTSLQPIATPSTTTTYTLTAQENGCSAQASVTITVTQKLTIPTTFSPNNDGVNDTWEIVGIENYPNCSVKIFSRWGQEVYQSIGYTKKKEWDGNGTAEGVYFYIIELRDESKEILKGYINLVR